jgi:hypothetical protein
MVSILLLHIYSLITVLWLLAMKEGDLEKTDLGRRILERRFLDCRRDFSNKFELWIFLSLLKRLFFAYSSAYQIMTGIPVEHMKRNREDAGCLRPCVDKGTAQCCLTLGNWDHLSPKK